MARVHLTDKIAREAPLPATADWHIPFYDDEVSGFGVRVTRKGARAWVYRYRHNRRTRIYTIGSPPSWKAKTARREAQRLTRLVDQGYDPQGEKDAARQAPTVNDLCERYLAEHAVKKRSAAGDERMIERIIRLALGSRKVADIKFADIDLLHRKVSANGSSGKRAKGSPYAANRIVALLSKMFALAIKWEMRTDNPAKGVERNVENPRERYLSPAEIARLSEALAVHPSQVAADAIRLLLLSGARRMEVLSAHSSDFDLETKVWTKPAQNTKQGRIHQIPLEGALLELVTRLKGEAKGDYLFPGRGTPHLTDVKKSWAAVCRAAQLGAVRIHDLRHTYASILASGGSNLLLIGKLLGHSNAATTARYSHLFDEPQRAATKAAGDIITGKPKAEVHQLAQPDRARR